MIIMRRLLGGSPLERVPLALLAGTMHISERVLQQELFD
jgi:hypothetical protein